MSAPRPHPSSLLSHSALARRTEEGEGRQNSVDSAPRLCFHFNKHLVDCLQGGEQRGGFIAGRAPSPPRPRPRRTRTRPRTHAPMTPLQHAPVAAPARRATTRSPRPAQLWTSGPPPSSLPANRHTTHATHAHDTGTMPRPGHGLVPRLE